MSAVVGHKMKMEMRIALLAFVAAGVAGCATPRLTQQEEVENLKTRDRVLTATLAACDAELAKDGKYVVRPGDTLAKVAKDNGITVNDLLRLNPDLKYGDVHSWRPTIVLKIRETTPNEASQAIGAAAPQPER